MLIYEQVTGRLVRSAVILAIGYSGNGEGLNNPDMQNVRNVGPCPVGLYTFGVPVDTDDHGPYFLALLPDPSNQMFGRSGMGMHGDEKEHPGEHLASDGCLIFNRATRVTVYNSRDMLQVVALLNEDALWPGGD
jgi:hypothetical protein